MNGGAHTPSSELGSATYKKAPIPAPWKALFGELAEGASVMVYGDAGAGKTTNMIALARGLCKAGLKTLYVSFEQFETDGLKQALKRAGGACPGLFFAGKAEKTAGYGCVVIDSTSAAGWGIDELRAFLQANKGKLIFYIVQSTKDGNFRGGNDLKHEADTVLKITASKLFTEKNRFGALAETRNPFAGKALEGGLGSPALHREDGFVFSFFSNDHKPMHVHVEGKGGEAKFEISPVKFVNSRGMASKDLKKIEAIVKKKQAFFIDRWNDFFKE